MDMTNQEYCAYVGRMAKPSPMAKDLAWAFFVGGLICTAGQWLLGFYRRAGLSQDSAGAAASMKAKKSGRPELFTTLTRPASTTSLRPNWMWLCATSTRWRSSAFRTTVRGGRTEYDSAYSGKATLS